MKNKLSLRQALQQRVLMIDGAMGTLIQQHHLSEADFRGERFAEHPYKLLGCNDVLSTTKPEVIKHIHRTYIEHGADIIEANSFNANTISMAEYGLADCAYEIAYNAVKIAREVADEFPDRDVYVVGSVGPTNKSLSLSPDVANPAMRAIDWKTLSDALRPQLMGIIEAGADAILFETAFDTLNAKCALYTAERIMEELGVEIPLMLSATLTESGRLLSGQTLEAFIASVQHFKILTLGLNCGFGADAMVPYIKQLQEISPFYLSVYPNAGLPNEMGEYDESPETMCTHLTELLADGQVNILGGCCGTTPEHIKAIADRVHEKNIKPFTPSAERGELMLSGLDALPIGAGRNFTNIGERCNVAGSRKFLRLINEKKYSEAVEIACKQVENGAQVIDLNMDDAMLDAKAELTHFINLISSEPDVARVPFMIDSSDWSIIEATLPLLQGKGIVNSISLKEGEEVFCRHAKFIRDMGAAMVVMAFDEVGQATSAERKKSICRRAYDILTQRVGVPATDIIFDPNVLSIATGIEEHNDYAKDFIEAVRYIKTELPGAKVSGGISNLSFALRGNNYVREAMHSVFLYYAIQQGQDMAIVNAGNIIPYDDIPASLKRCIETVFFRPSQQATEELLEEAAKYSKNKVSASATTVDDSSLTDVERLANAIVRGRSEGLIELLEKVHNELGTAIKVIDEPLMSGMNEVGWLFGEGKLFLPQVVKSARVMKEAVEWLNPFIESEKSSEQSTTSHKMVLATVKGDVHDIGKNIVAVVMRCNGFEVIDLGTMVPCEKIVSRAIEEKVELVALSGLITPSLNEMCNVAKLMQQKGMSIPLMVGGATTSKLHTAVKIAPCYDGAVAWTGDAAVMPVVAKKILEDESYTSELKEEQSKTQEQYSAQKPLLSLTDARARAVRVDWSDYRPVVPREMHPEAVTFSIADVQSHINWRPFFTAWKLGNTFASLSTLHNCQACRTQWLSAQKDQDKAKQAMTLFDDAQRMLQELHLTGGKISAKVDFWNVRSKDDTIEFVDKGIVIPTLRQQKDAEKTRSLADYVSPKQDIIATFAVTIGTVLNALVEQKKKQNNDYEAILAQSLCDRLVEAATELMHQHVRNTLWGYSDDKGTEMTLVKQYPGIRPAIGYPSLPDQSVIFDVDRIMPLEGIGITLTENGAMYPVSSTCGLMISHPESEYFMIGTIADDQKQWYASARGISKEELSKWLR